MTFFPLLFQLFFYYLQIEANPTTLPFNGAFILQRLNKQSTSNLNGTQISDLYLQNGCPNSADQVIGQRIAGHYYSTNIYTSIQNPYCVVNVKLAKERIYLDRPYIDVIVLRDQAWINVYKYRLCVTVQFTNSAGASVSGSCILHERHLHKQTCVIRQTIPFSWFDLHANQLQPSEHLISVSYSIKSQCSAPEYPLFNQRIRLLSTVEKFGVLATNSQPDGQLSLLARPNLQFTTDSLNSVIFHFKPPATTANNESSTSSSSIVIWVWIDARFEIVSATVMEPNKWRMKVESATEPNSYVTFTLNAIDEVDNFERRFESYLFALLLRLHNNNERPEMAARTDTSAFLFVDWALADNGNSVDVLDEFTNSTKNRITKRIPIVQDSPYTVVAVTKSIDLINTAVLNGLQVSEPMRIFVLTEAGETQDITDQSHCSSAEPRLLKVSSTCTSVYIDGSELRGLANVVINIQYKSIRAYSAFNVWYPRLPISVWASDKTLNAVNDWRVPGWKHFDNKRKRRQNALQSVCQNRYQQAEIKVLAAFQVIDETSGELTFLSGSRDLLFDVTQVVMSRIGSTDNQILSVKRRDDRLIVTGKARGNARVVVRAVTANIDYGGTQISVTNEPVSAVQLLLRSITDVQLSLKSKHGIPFQYELTTHIGSEFTQQYQHGSLEIEIFYSDGQKELLSDVDTSLYALNIYSASEKSLRIRQQKGSSNIELVMLDADSQMVLTAEMRGPNVCEESEIPALASGQTRLNSQLKRSYNLVDGRVFPDAERIQLNISSNSTKNDTHSISLQTIIALLLILLMLFGLFHLISLFNSRGFHGGYEKLVMPFIARLSSSGSLANNEQVGEGENATKEWVWMPKKQPSDTMSVASHFSQRSTLGISNATTSSNGSNGSSSSSDSISTGCGTTKSVSISYRGSEISVFIAPQEATVSVNEEQRLRHQPTASWKSTNGRSSKVQQRPNRYRYSNEMATSSVHDNLDKYCRNTPLGQSGRASSTMNGIMRRSSDQMHQTAYFSNNYSKRPRKDNQLQRFRLTTAPESTISAEDEFFSIRHPTNHPTNQGNASHLPSYTSVYSNNDGSEYPSEQYYHHKHRASNGWVHSGRFGEDSGIIYAPQQSNRSYPNNRQSTPVRETVA